MDWSQVEALVQFYFKTRWEDLLNYPITKLWQDYQWAEYYQQMEYWREAVLASSKL